MKDILKIHNTVNNMHKEEVSSYLKTILVTIQQLKEQSQFPEGAIQEPVGELVELYTTLMGLPAKTVFWEPATDSTHVHIVVGDSFAGSMKQALKELGWDEAHKLIILRDNYATGPLGRIDTPEGRNARVVWFRENISGYSAVSDEYEDEYNELINHVERIPAQAKVIIWTSSNASEQTGMRLAVHLLASKHREIVVCDACAVCEELYNRPEAFINYVSSGEIPADRLKEALLRVEDGYKLTDEEVTRLTREWREISEQAQALRIWYEDSVVEVPADYYDAYLLEKLDDLQPPPGQDGFLRSARLVGEALGYCGQFVGDAYFEYRIRELIYSGILEIKGVPAAMRYYSVRRKQGAETGN